MLSNHDITALIRDTEPHERALFSVPPPPPAATPTNPNPAKPPARRQTVFNVTGGEVTTGPAATAGRAGPRRNTAVAAVLGGDLHAMIARRGAPATGPGDVDLEVLLHGAEKLCSVYPLPGAPERVTALRQKYSHQCNTLAYYEAKVAEQQEALERINADRWADEEEQQADDGADAGLFTEQNLRAEEEEVRELERKKKELNERLRAMDKDLGGLLHM